MARARVVANDKRKYGKRWEVRWSWTDRDGRHFEQLAFATKAEADAYATDLNGQLQRGYMPKVSEGRRTVEEYAGEWLSSLKNVRPRTREGYRQLLDNHVLPVFAEFELREVRRSDVEAYVRALEAKGLTPPTIKQAFMPLQRVLQRAVDDDALLKNPASGVKLPTDRATRRRKPKPNFLTPEQVAALAAVLDEQPPYGLLVRFLAYTGLRAGELAGLRVGDVAMGRVTVERTLRKVCQCDAHPTGWDEQAPKSENSVRTVPMPGWLREDVRDYLADVHPRGDDPTAPLFPSRHLRQHQVTLGVLDWSEPWERDNFGKAVFKPALRAAGLPATARLHDLRHTYASICASEGIEPARISKRLGHSTVAFTLDIYTHLFESDEDADMAKLDRPSASLGGNVRRLGA